VLSEDVDASEGVDALADHVLAALGGGDAIVVSGGVASGGSDFVSDLVGGAGVVAGAIDVDAGVVDDDVCAFLREEEGDGASDATAGAGDDGVAIGQAVRHEGLLIDPAGWRKTLARESPRVLP